MEIQSISELLQLGTTGALFAWFIYWFFKSRKEAKDPMNGTGKSILEAIEKQNNNHLVHFQSCMDENFKELQKSVNAGNDRIVDAIKQMHIDLLKK